MALSNEGDMARSGNLGVTGGTLDQVMAGLGSGVFGLYVRT